uniref:Ig-like domain-containing protein n=1 Tax=Poecilia mexicana TaxID=48701 RepID=A0A3B3YZU5_9TELE
MSQAILDFPIDPNKPSLVLQPNWSQIYRGEKVTLRCEIQGGTQWTYEWRSTNRNSPSSSEYRINSATDPDSREYSCRGIGEGNRLNVVSVVDAVLTVEPNWSTFYSGEFVTFTCDRNEAEATDWECRLNRDNEPYLSINPDKSITLEPLQHSGEFQCCGRRRSSNKTKCSNTVTVSGKPTATLAADSTTIPEGGSVTLSCSVEPSAGWKFRWFRRTINTPEAEITTNNIENRNITVTQEGIYRCEGVRGNPAFISHLSNEVTIEIICEFFLKNSLMSNY